MQTRNLFLTFIILLFTSMSFAQKGEIETKSSKISPIQKTKRKKLIKKEGQGELTIQEKRLNLIRYLNTSYSLGESLLASYNSNEKRIFMNSGRKYISQARETMANLERSSSLKKIDKQKIHRIMELISSSYSYMDRNRKSTSAVKLREAKKLMDQITPEFLSSGKRVKVGKLR